MARFSFLQPVLRVVFAVVLGAVTLPAVGQKTLPLKQGAPGVQTNHRLILKDGSYQIVRKYEIVGDRVRYISVERSGEWEEMPADLIDWNATKKWDRDHVEPAYSNDTSDGMKEAEELDKEEAAKRAEEQARMPQVAPGLELPDQDAVFALDTFQGTPELVELQPAELAVDAKTHHGLSSFNPMAAAKASIELPGSHAKVHLHVNDPAIYLSLELASDAEAASHSMTVYTGGSKEATNRKRGAHSTQSGFAIVRVSERNKVRIIGALHISHSGDVSQDENIVPTKVEVLPGKHWLKVTPAQPLDIGDYALVEILSPTDINQTVWDFRVNPTLGDNTGSLTPILKQNSDRQW